MGWNESANQGADRPVENVTWFDAVEFCNRSSLLAGKPPVYGITNITREGNHITGAEVTADWAATGYRLLTESEWEHACRAMSQTAFCDGGITNLLCAPVDPDLDTVGWYCGNAVGATHDVGGKNPNGWGLYDMHGNVSEWCWDWWGTYPAEVTFDPLGPESGTLRVFRGGSQHSDAQHCRSAVRGYDLPGHRDAFIGLRIARTAE
jgi:formylglycine-generating enzyme required for sulfatase activity